MGVIRVGQRLPDQKSNATTSSGFAWAAEKFITGWSERDELGRCMFVDGKPCFGECNKIGCVVGKNVVQVDGVACIE